MVLGNIYRGVRKRDREEKEINKGCVIKLVIIVGKFYWEILVGYVF